MMRCLPLLPVPSPAVGVDPQRSEVEDDGVVLHGLSVRGGYQKVPCDGLTWSDPNASVVGGGCAAGYV